MDWKAAGYWQHFTDPPYGSTCPCLKDNEHVRYDEAEKAYICHQISQETDQRAITLQRFKEMDFGIIISSLPNHWVSFQKLADMKGAKHIAQVGNIGPTWLGAPVANVMSSVPPSIYKRREGQNIVYYHQEFDTNIFKPTAPMLAYAISSFIHIMPGSELYAQVKAALPEYNFSAFGVGRPNGQLPRLRDVAEKMMNSMFGWQVKPEDGYGHVLHNWLAVGRPVITKLSDYEHRRNILIPDVTCIDVDGKDAGQVASEIRRCSQPETYDRMCASVREVFAREVNFDADAERIKLFMERLI